MLVIDRGSYDLLMNVDPCSVFPYYGVEEMHGLNLTDCRKHPNTKQNAYIAGWCNFIPKNTPYQLTDKHFVFINLSRCNTEAELIITLFHEFMHLSIDLHGENLELEEEMITWADKETAEVFELTKNLI